MLVKGNKDKAYFIYFQTKPTGKHRRGGGVFYIIIIHFT